MREDFTYKFSKICCGYLLKLPSWDNSTEKSEKLSLNYPWYTSLSGAMEPYPTLIFVRQKNIHILLTTKQLLSGAIIINLHYFFGP